jgi:hypothetical protein
MNLKLVNGKLVRPAFRAEVYTTPAPMVDALRGDDPSFGSEDQWDDFHHGVFAGWTRHRDFEQGGKRWMTLFNNDGQAVEVELTRGQPYAVNALPPDESWRIARAWDARAQPPIDVEP